MYNVTFIYKNNSWKLFNKNKFLEHKSTHSFEIMRDEKLEFIFTYALHSFHIR